MDPWYSQGLRFQCTECGKCCSGAPGHVWVTPDEIAAIAEYMDLSVEDFSEKYVRRVGKRYSLTEQPDSYTCTLLKNKLCSIYPVRPKQCRTFPFWPEHLVSPEGWLETRVATYPDI